MDNEYGRLFIMQFCENQAFCTRRRCETRFYAGFATFSSLFFAITFVQKIRFFKLTFFLGFFFNV